MPPPRRIAHLDMDAFFASVELLRRPELRGLPLVVGGRGEGGPRPLRTYAGRGVVTTATYEARALGVRSGMGLMKAAELAPEALLLPTSFEAYQRASRAFKAAVAEIAPRMEDRGIDEIYLDLTELPESSEPLGRRLQGAVRRATGLSCSIGMSPNRLLSKIASDLEKPGGLSILGPGDLEARIWPLPCSAVGGVGPKAASRLQALGIHRIGELARADPALLVARFGRGYGAWLHEAAWGRDESPLVLVREPRSMSRETTFARDLDPGRDRAELTRILRALCARLAEDLARRGYGARSVGVKLRFEDFDTLTRDQSLPRPVSDAASLLAAARASLRRVPLDRRLRLLGLHAGALVKAGALLPEAAPSLFPELGP